MSGKVRLALVDMMRNGVHFDILLSLKSERAEIYANLKFTTISYYSTIRIKKRNLANIFGFVDNRLRKFYINLGSLPLLTIYKL